MSILFTSFDSFLYLINYFSSPINCLCIVDNCVLATGDDDGYVKVNKK